jgi:hypothetical protein
LIECIDETNVVRIAVTFTLTRDNLFSIEIE